MKHEFYVEDFSHVAALIRGEQRNHALQAILSNNLNLILAALDAQGYEEDGADIGDAVSADML